MKIAFIPIDNRPVCYSLAEQISKIDGEIELLLPPRELLGDLTKTADVVGILDWLKNLEGLDKLIVSLDTIAYGGLVPSRRSEDSVDVIKKRLKKFKSIFFTENVEIHAFSSVMRISNNNINEEEKEYWNLYGEKIFKYSFDMCKNGNAKTDVPEEILKDYISTRRRNFEINKMYIDWAKDGFFKTLVFGKDDCAEYGLNVFESKVLLIHGTIQDIYIQVKTGADEIPLSLLTKAIVGDREIKICPVFMNPDSVNKISKYEDVSVYNSVKGQLELAGCKITEEDNAEIILLVNNFKDEQGELVMGVDVQGFSGSLTLPKKPYFGADILNANGADNNFVEQLFNFGYDKKNFLGYAGWNTTGNTLGSAICCAVVKYFAKKLDDNAFKKVQTIRFLDDWAYQANVRKELKTKLNNPSEVELKNSMKLYEEKVFDFLGIKEQSINYSYPWNRFFEIEINID